MTSKLATLRSKIKFS